MKKNRAVALALVLMLAPGCEELANRDGKARLTEALEQTAPPDSHFQKVVLDASVNQPMELAVAPDGRVFFLDRTGKVELYRPASGTTVTAAYLDVDVTGNHGLIGLALDPAFATNRWLYLYYSPKTPSVNRLSRFSVVGDTVDLASEKVLLEIPTQRICCHEGGSITFSADGNLYLSTGDNADPFASDGFAPIDERSGRLGWDAQRSSANTKDLRGKVLRIRPQADGTYTIPAGNLFTSATAGRPEIYVMGLRNPFRISVDAITGWLYWGEIGPDASNDGATRGPRGYDEYNQAKSAGNYGWPYCIANNKPYFDYDFSSNTPGAAFDCNAPVNNSPNNTGATNLPAARPAWIFYPYGSSTEFPAVGTASNRAAMAGPVYHHSASAPAIKLPLYYDNRLFIYDWSRDWIQTVRMDTNGNILAIERFLSTFTFSSPIDVEMGPDGALYVLEWGAGSGHNSGADAKLSRIEFKGSGGSNPVAMLSATPDAGATPLTVTFSSAGSRDPEGSTLTYAWDFTADGTVDSTQANPTFQYTTAGNYIAKLTVRDSEGKTGVTSLPITVGNARPVVTLADPLDGGFISWGEEVRVNASVTDREDGSTASTTISCNDVQIVPGLGHDDHSHTDPPMYACQTVVQLPALPADHAEGDTTYAISAAYTDRGSGSIARLSGSRAVKLQPKHKQAEHYTRMSGITLQNTGDVAGGGLNIASINNGDWISFAPMNLKNMLSVTYRVASAGAGGTIEVRRGSTTGTLLSTATIPTTGGWQTYTNVTANITDPSGSNELFFVFKGTGTGGLFNLNWIDFNGAGISTPRSGTSPAGTLYEGELALMSGAVVDALNGGFTGSGYADMTGPAGSYVEWTVVAPTPGTYTLEIRYANGGTANRPMEIKVGNTVVGANVAFNPTGSWTTWSTVRIVASLAAGSNKVRATTTGASGANFDSLALPVFQGENAIMSRAFPATLNGGFTGSGYADFESTTGGYLQWVVNAPAAGTYTLEFRYALGATAARGADVMVGNVVAASGLSFAPTGNWTTWSTKTASVTLAAGPNTIRFTSTGVDGPNVDAMTRR